MTTPRPELVVSGQVVVVARPDGLETAESVGIANGRVVVVGPRGEVVQAAAPGARVIDAGDAAVVPGIHDFHLHLVGMARARRAVGLDDAADFVDLLGRVAAAARALAPDAWLTGRGWSEATLDRGALDRLEAAVGERPSFLTSHDGHSAWASAAARRLGRIGPDSPNPAGGRIERDGRGAPTGVLREAAMEPVAAVAGRLRGAALWTALDEVLRDMAALGITGASEAGDYTDENGVGSYAALGDSFSSLAEHAGRIEGRLRLTLGIPADALDAAAALGLRTGQPLASASTIRFGWAKEYADGALGSRTAALFAPYTCGDGADTGILRVPPAELDRLFAAARRSGIGMAVHAIGDRANAAVLDAVERADLRSPGAPLDRLEHAQLVRPNDRPRFAPAGIVASMQPIHAAADREMVERCWDGRQAHAYAFRSLARAGTLLAFGSDAPVESVNPWSGLFAAVHRRFPNEAVPDWRPEEALDAVGALSAYTRGPAVAVGAHDEGHLRPGARADLAVLDVALPTLLAAGEPAAAARSQLTLVDGNETHR